MGKIKDVLSKVYASELMPSNNAFSIGGRFSLETLSRKKLLSQYGGLVFSCVNVRAQAVADYEPLIYVKNPRVVKDQEPLEDHPFLQFLENISPYLSTYEFIELTQIFMDLTGEAFWYIELGEVTRTPKAAIHIEPHRVQVSVDSFGDIVGYIVTKDDGTEIPIELDEMVHFKYPDPQNPLRGKSPTGANLLYVDTEQQTAEFQNAFMRNSATPSGVVMMKGSVTEDVFKKIKTQWKYQQSGAGNAGKTLFLRNGDFEFQKLGLSLADLDLDQLRGQTTDDVRKAFRVPKPKLGDTDGAGLGRDGAETVNYIFASDVVDTLQSRLDDTLQRYARRVYKDPNIFIGHVCKIPEDKAHELLEKRLRLDEWNLGVNRWVTVNQINEAKGLPDVDGGDVLYRNLGQVPLDEDYVAPVKPQAKMITRTITTKARELPAKKALSQTDYFGGLDNLENRVAEQYTNELRKYLKKQQKRVLSLLDSKKSLEDDVLVGFTGEEDNLILNIVEVGLGGAKSAGELATEYVDSPVVYDIPDTYPVALEDDTRRAIVGFNEQTRQALRESISQGLEKGEDYGQLVKRVKDTYRIAEDSRAERIARTETHRIANESVSDAYFKSGIQSVQWVTDSDPCELCEAMEGTITDIGVPFLEVGDTIEGVSGKNYTVDYADVKHADLHPNCACKLVPVTPGQGNFSITPEKVVVKIVDDEENSQLREALLKEKAFTEELKKIIGLDDA